MAESSSDDEHLPRQPGRGRRPSQAGEDTDSEPDVVPDLPKKDAKPITGIVRGSVRGSFLPTGKGAGAAREAAASGGGGVFGGLRTKGEDIREELLKPEYNVMDYYKKKGPIQRIARHGSFEMLTLLIITINAFWIGIDSEWNIAPEIRTSRDYFKFMENFFCIYFTGEVIIRFFAFQYKSSCLNDGWFKFDTLLVGMMIFETWIMPSVAGPVDPVAYKKMLLDPDSGGGGMGQLSILRLLRLLRLTRMVRLMRAVPELVTLIKGMTKATRSVGSTLLLLIIVLYIFAIIFTGMLGCASREYEGVGWLYKCAVPKSECSACQDHYGGIWKSMYTLFLSGTLLDNAIDVTMEYRNNFLLMYYVYLLFVLFSSFTILNMLIGVLCEVVSAVAAEEGEKAMVMDTQRRLTEVYRLGDEDGSGTITADEFNHMSQMPSVLNALSDIGVEKKHFSALASVLFEDDENPGTTRTLNFDDFVRQIVMLRPEKSASVMDVADLRFCLRSDVSFASKHHLAHIDRLIENQKALDEPLEKILTATEALEARLDSKGL